MDPLTMGGIGMGMSVLGSGLGFIFGSRGNAQADRLIQQAMDNWDSLKGPDKENLILELERLGHLEPAEVQQAQQTLLADYQEDPRLQQSQMGALSALEEMATGGVTDGDRAAMREMGFERAQQERSQRDALTQGAAQRNQAGSGFMQAQQLLAQQQGANRSAGDGRALATEAQRRALTAMAMQGDLARGIEGDRFGREAQKASAMDTINMFNTGWTNNASLQNHAINNQRDQTNLGQGNLEEQSKQTAELAEYGHRRGQLEGKNSLIAQKAGLAQQQGQNAANFATSVGATGSRTMDSLIKHDAAKNAPQPQNIHLHLGRGGS